MDQHAMNQHQLTLTAAGIATGLGFTPDELIQLRQQVQAAVDVQSNAVLQKIKAQVTKEAQQVGVSTRDEVRSALIKTAAISIIGGGILGGVLGFVLAKKFR